LRTQFFLEAFARAAARPHGYMIDMKQNTPDILRLRTFIFPGEEQKAYVESKGQGAGPEKGLFSALLDFQKRHFL
jgi:hypothetical protein